MTDHDYRPDHLDPEPLIVARKKARRDFVMRLVKLPKGWRPKWKPTRERANNG